MKYKKPAFTISNFLKFQFLPLAHLLLGLLAVIFSSMASAKVLDTVDVVKVGNDTAITIRFSTEIQYLRHAPANQSNYLRIFVRVTRPDFNEQEVMQDVLRSPSNAIAPRFTVTYPELVNAVAIAFDRVVRYSVSPGRDSRSIVITIPDTGQDAKKGTLPGSTGIAASQPSPPESLGKPPVTPRLTVKDSKPTPDRPSTEARPDSKDTTAGTPQSVQIPDATKPEDNAQKLSQEQLEDLAGNLFREATTLVNKGDLANAINRIVSILTLPQNSQTESAQALIGEAREKNGEINKARAEYQLYLKLYPEGAHAEKIRSRIAALPETDVVRRQARRPAKDDKPAEWTVNGSLSSYWFTGQSRMDSGPVRRDQDMAVSNISLNARLRDASSDTRIVFRNTDSRNFLQDHRNYNRIYSAYFEKTDREAGYFYRVGRQNPTGAGVLERFDGVNASYNLGSGWKLGAVAGTAVEFPRINEGWFSLPSNRQFYGTSIDYQPQVGRPGASLYVIEQTLDRYLSRRAVGSELRYFDGQLTAFGILDYDLLYKSGLNIGMLQANYTDARGITYFANYDYRKSPTYGLANALPNLYPLGITDVAGMVRNLGMEEARKLVVDSTPTMVMLGAGMTIPYKEKWQLGLDYRSSQISGTNATIQLNQVCKSLGFNAMDPNDPICVGGPLGDVPISQMCSGTSYDPNNNTCTAGQNSQGSTVSYTAQIIASDFLAKGATGLAMMSSYTGPGIVGQSYNLNYIYPFAQTWRAEGNLRYFLSRTELGSEQKNVWPSLKLAYQASASLFIEGEIGHSDQRSTGLNASINKRDYLHLGIRWDLR